ncbi:MAG: hypothetical protein WD271_16365 [Acidimicrobiia bacterium]
MSTPKRLPTGAGVVIGGLILVLCCAGPALVAGGALAAVGSILGNPAVIAAGAALLVGAFAVPYTRHARARRLPDCSWSSQTIRRQVARGWTRR